MCKCAPLETAESQKDQTSTYATAAEDTSSKNLIDDFSQFLVSRPSWARLGAGAEANRKTLAILHPASLSLVTENLMFVACDPQETRRVCASYRLR